MDDNRRSYYRVEPESPTDFLEVVMYGPEGGPYTGKVLDSSSGGVAVVFPRDKAPDLQIGDGASLEFELPEVDEPLALDAVVRGRRDDARYLRVSLRFYRLGRLSRGMPPEVWKVFNRRAVARVKIGFDSPVWAEVVAPESDAECVGVLHDFSRAGFGIALAPNATCSITSGAQVVVKMALPGQKEPMAFRGELVNRVERDEGLILGVALDAGGEGLAEEQQAALDRCLAAFAVSVV